MKVKKRLELWGWGLFSAGSGIYFVESLINGNPLAMTGSAAFCIGCVCFILSERFKD